MFEMCASKKTVMTFCRAKKSRRNGSSVFKGVSLSALTFGQRKQSDLGMEKTVNTLSLSPHTVVTIQDCYFT